MSVDAVSVKLKQNKNNTTKTRTITNKQTNDNKNMTKHTHTHTHTHTNTTANNNKSSQVSNETVSRWSGSFWDDNQDEQNDCASSSSGVCVSVDVVSVKME